MTEKIFDEFTAREVFDWLIDEYADEYIKQDIVEMDDESVISNVFDVELLKKHFLYHVRRYSVIKRGYKFYIHDERHCKDIMMFKFTDDTEVETENYVHAICEDLNKGSVHFVGKRYRCG